jgi:hypothetical protein
MHCFCFSLLPHFLVFRIILKSSDVTQPTDYVCSHCSETLISGLLQLDLCTSLNIGLVLYTFTPPPSDPFDPVQVHGPFASPDAATMLQSALTSESFVGRALELEGNRNLLSATTSNVDAALASLASFQWRPLAARVAIMFPRNAPPGLEIHHISDSSCSVGSTRWWQSCEKLRSMSVELHAVRMLSSYPYGPVSSHAFVQAGYPFSAFKGRNCDSMDARAVAAFDEVTMVGQPSPQCCSNSALSDVSLVFQAVKTWHVACNNPKLSSAVSDSMRRLAFTAHAAYASAVDACCTVQTQQTGGVFLKVADVPSALASLPQLIAQSLDMRLFTEAVVCLPCPCLHFMCFSPHCGADQRSGGAPGAAAAGAQCRRSQAPRLAVVAAQQRHPEVRSPVCAV